MTLSINERIKKEQIELEKIIEKAITYAKKQGADQAKIYVSKSTGLDVSVRNQEVENISFNKNRVLGITVYCNNSKANCTTSDLSDDAIYSSVDAAIAIAHYTQKDPFAGLPEKDDLMFETIDLDILHPLEPDPDFSTKQAIELEKLALNHPLIKQTINSSFCNRYGQSIVGNTYGQIITSQFSYFSSSIGLIGEKDGVMENGYGYHFACDINDLWSIETIAKEAIDKTIRHIGARKIKTISVPVIFDKSTATTLFNFLISALSGKSQFKKTSFLNDCLNTQVLPNWLSVYEDPLIKKEFASSYVDNDGAKTIPRFIVEDGVVKSYLLSAYSARQLKLKNTGNAGGIYNWIINSKNKVPTKNELLKTLDKGLIVTSLMGHGFDPITGDYSFGAKGLWVEQGEILYPVHEITIAGNAKDTLKNIIAIDNDINKKSQIKTGNILVDTIKIAGK